MEQNRNIQTGAAFHLLKGQWLIERRIDGIDRMSGMAEYRETSPGHLSYSEKGSHRIGQEILDFYQSYYLRHFGRDLHVNFTDGRPFHSLSFQQDDHILKAEALHLCGNDTYRGKYVFHNDNRFTVSWNVHGPRKNYTIETNYFRQGPC